MSFIPHTTNIFWHKKWTFSYRKYTRLDFSPIYVFWYFGEGELHTLQVFYVKYHPFWSGWNCEFLQGMNKSLFCWRLEHFSSVMGYQKQEEYHEGASFAVMIHARDTKIWINGSRNVCRDIGKFGTNRAPFTKIIVDQNCGLLVSLLVCKMSLVVSIIVIRVF